jgi:hypothetical protein
MLPRERIQAAFEHRPSDKVPIYQAGFSSYAASLVLGREAYTGGGIQQFREARALWNGPEAHAEYLLRSRNDAFEVAEILDLDLIRPMYWRLAEKPTRKIDELTYVYGSEAAGNWRVMSFDPTTELYQVLASAPQPEPTLADLERSLSAAPLNPDSYRPQPADWPDLVAAVERFGKHRAIPGFGTGLCIPREPIWLEACILRPDLLRERLAEHGPISFRGSDIQDRCGVIVVPAIGLRRTLLLSSGAVQWLGTPATLRAPSPDSGYRVTLNT